ncbi:hypothetical protein C4569_01885 [Candidatus Parcubacteria bacterium]|nr:MAG: hypothetical protein C4569_01885 [Candidatus Parcubacteria bacterium]
MTSKAHIVAVDMGYGHQRAAYPLKFMAKGGKIINANSYKGIPTSDKRIWDTSRSFYEFISRFSNVPFIGKKAFSIYDKNFQGIPPFYPKRDLSKPSFQLKEIYNMLKKSSWGKDLILRLEKNPLPLVTTFFVPAYMAEYYKYSGDIYLIICDADVSRAWVALHPNRSKIKYLVPSRRVAERLQLYGVPEKNIFLTGFPLPLENLGDYKLSLLRRDFGLRLPNLDPRGIYAAKYERTIQKHLGLKNYKKKSDHKLNVMFAVGGAGAQKGLAVEIIKSLKDLIAKKKIIVTLVAGIHNHIYSYFKKEIAQLGLLNSLCCGINIIYSNSKEEYFKKFNYALRQADILWTKPSELSFYCALGLPIIIAPPIGEQEIFNKRWLEGIGAGISQDDPKYTSEWLFDWINSGWLAEAAMQGFLEASKFGTYNVERVVAKKPEETLKVKTILQY